MKSDLKKLLILNAPYLLFVYLFDKIGQAVRLSPGADLSGKVLSLADGFSAAFASPLPSLALMDLLIGIAGAVLIRLMVYFKGKNAKKYRKGAVPLLLRRQAAFRLHGLSHSPPLPVQTIVSDERLSYSLSAEPATKYIQTQYLPFHSCTQRRTQAFSRLSYPGFGYSQGLHSTCF